MRFVVKAVSQKPKSYAICDENNVWYSAFGKCPIQKGDTVDLEFQERGEFKNISSITKVSQQGENDKKHPAAHSPSAGSSTNHSPLLKDSELVRPSMGVTPPAAILDKDRLIVRQSCLKAAVEFVNCEYEHAIDKKQDFQSDVLEIAEKFENWVFR